MFGVKQSLVVDLHPADEETAKKCDVKPGTLTLNYDFVLVSEEAAKDLRDEKSRKSLEARARGRSSWMGYLFLTSTKPLLVNNSLCISNCITPTVP